MKTNHLNLGIAALCALCISQSQAAVSQVADYRLGEAGSVGATQPYTALVDSIGGYNIPTWNSPVTKTSVITTGLAAPGSTAALQISSNAGAGGTWYGGQVNGAAGLVDNWAFSLWLRPDATGGTFLGATDGDGNAATGLRFWATNNTNSGTSASGNLLTTGSNYLLMSNGSGFLGSASSTYTAGEWVNIALIQRNGTLNYYLNQTLQDSAVMSGSVKDVRLGAGYFASAASNGAFDEMKIWSFDSTDSLASVEQSIFAIPEPSSTALLGLGGLALCLRRRK